MKDEPTGDNAKKGFRVKTIKLKHSSSTSLGSGNVGILAPNKTKVSSIPEADVENENDKSLATG